MGAFDDLIPQQGGNAFADLIPSDAQTGSRSNKPTTSSLAGNLLVDLVMSGPRRTLGTTQALRYGMTPEQIASNPIMRFANKAQSGALGIAQLAGQAMLPLEQMVYGAFGGQVPNEPAANTLIRNMKRTEQIARQGMAPDEVDMAGFAGELLDPVGLKLTKLGKPAKSVVDRIKQSAKFGAIFGASRPVDSDKDNFEETKALQVGAGGVSGAAFGGAFELAKFIGRPAIDAFRALLPSSAQRLAREFNNEIVGKENMPKILKRLEEEAAKRPPIQGYQPTVGELLAGAPEASPLIALQKATARTTGGPSAKFEARAMEQDAALRNALRTIAGTPDELAVLQQNASSNAAANYGPAMGRRVSLASDTSLIGDDIARAQGVPMRVPSSGSLPGGNVPYTGRAGALQQQGIMQTEAAQQANFANNWFPVPGMPRAPARYSHNIERVPEAQAGARTAADKISLHDSKIGFLETAMTNLRNEGALATESAAPLLQRPSMQNAMEYARRLAAERGYKFPQSLDDQFTGQNLHDIKLGLDAQIRAGAAKNTPNSLDNSTLEAISGTKSQFIKWFEQKVPEYGKARVEFAKDMARPNQMKVAQALEDKLLNPQGQMTPGAFMRAISDETKTIKTVTGQPRQDFASIFNPRQNETIQGVGGLLERRLLADTHGNKVSIGSKNIAEEGTQLLPNMLSRPVMLANWMLKLATGSRSSLEHRIDDLNTAYMLNPQSFMAAMRELPPSTASRIMQTMRANGVSPMNQGLLAPLLTTTDQMR